MQGGSPADDSGVLHHVCRHNELEICRRAIQWIYRCWGSKIKQANILTQNWPSVQSKGWQKDRPSAAFCCHVSYGRKSSKAATTTAGP